MVATAQTLVSFDDALAIADEQGLTKLHVVRDSRHGRWTAVAQRYNGAQVATDSGDTFEDAVVRALMEIGIRW